MRPPPKNFKDTPFAYHQEIELEITALTNLGDGLGRVDGWVVMVPFALPGETVRARVWHNHANHSQADLVEVLKPSPHRVEPRCPLYGKCGGCQYQHFEYEAQLECKRSQVRELLQRLGGIEADVEPPQGSPEQYGYRSKLTPHWPQPRAGEFLPVGFLEIGSRQKVVDVPHCPIATGAINDVLPKAAARLRSFNPPPKRGGTLHLRETDNGVCTDPRAVAQSTVNGVAYRYMAGEFFQNNPYVLPLMVDHVKAEAVAGGARFLVDAYCGVGMFALALAPEFEKVAGVEINEAAVKLARENAQLNKRDNCAFIVGKAEAIFADIDFSGADTAMIIDPPRAGCTPEFLAQLLAFRPKRVVYVACDPATQARDAKILIEGGYRIARVKPFDLFPQTRHIENAITFDRA